MRSIAIGMGVLAGALLVSQPGAFAQTQKQMPTQANAGFCHVSPGTNARNCTFASMAACDKVRESQGGQCIPNAGTTGSGSPGGSSGMSGSGTSAPGAATSPTNPNTNANPAIKSK